MSFHQYGQTISVPRNEHVDIHVRRVTLNANAPVERHVEMVEVREFLKAGEVYGHGIVIPLREVSDLKIALDRVAADPEVAL